MVRTKETLSAAEDTLVGALTDPHERIGTCQTYSGATRGFVLAVFVLLAMTLVPVGPARADDVKVAVASNFTSPMQKIATAFEKVSGHKAIVSTGATGAFYAQIRNGAPFEVLLSADDETPAKLESEGIGIKGSRFTYAVGKLALWSAQANLVDEKGTVLGSGRFEHLALANPKTAPYGVAAVQVLSRMGIYDALRAKIVQGENISQTQQFVATGNAELGFVALSQVWKDGVVQAGSLWVVPADYYSPIRQDAILLSRGAGRPAALALLKYLQSDEAKAIIKSYGYSF